MSGDWIQAQPQCKEKVTIIEPIYNKLSLAVICSRNQGVKINRHSLALCDLPTHQLLDNFFEGWLLIPAISSPLRALV